MKKNPLDAYHLALRMATTIFDRRVAAAKKAHTLAVEKAWEKYKNGVSQESGPTITR